jgi:hypothetical protein
MGKKDAQRQHSEDVVPGKEQTAQNQKLKSFV